MIDSKDINFEEEMRRIYEEDYIGKRMSTLKLAEKYGHGNDYYSDWFHRFNLPLRSMRENRLQYHCNSDYFEKIDTEDKAYWLGFIYADGFITKGGKNYSKKVGITLDIKDKEHLYKFRNCIGGNMPINEYDAKCSNGSITKSCRIMITEPKMAEDLIKNGCVEHKTDILMFPDESILPKELRNHFIRGYFDGDGSISYNKDIERYRGQRNICFYGTDNMLNGILQELLDSNVTNRMYGLLKRKEGQIVSYFKFGGNLLVKRFCEYIYKDADIYLERKYNKYLELLKHLNALYDN